MKKKPKKTKKKRIIDGYYIPYNGKLIIIYRKET